MIWPPESSMYRNSTVTLLPWNIFLFFYSQDLKRNDDKGEVLLVIYMFVLIVLKAVSRPTVTSNRPVCARIPSLELSRFVDPRISNHSVSQGTERQGEKYIRFSGLCLKKIECISFRLGWLKMGQVSKASSSYNGRNWGGLCYVKAEVFLWKLWLIGYNWLNITVLLMMSLITLYAMV